ncbi:hypothetical protein [Mucilaginibacter psychrotolerans]|uniref:Uncharacterized protein n=1 Tax=Mucilaginibacter psychrotolerans TaxID=1524096 RepID=A0A4Y8S654_9SPHI|nr:hypothetical protein [Mucilaginibacter psychrotolerans]TFF34402.1 hypothetical protein E2R66_22265 [Mucilaginibacter psychrotolerans]
MTEQELYAKLKPLEPLFIQYANNKTGVVSATANALIKEVYPTVQEMALGALPRHYKSSCGSCVRNVMDVLVSLYFRLKEQAGDDTNDQ